MKLTKANLEVWLKQIEAIDDRSALQVEWQKLYGDISPPKYISLNLLKRAIAHRGQEKVMGGVKPLIKRHLETVYAKAQSDKPSKVKPPFESVKPGTRLLREWQGRFYEVVILPKGVLLDGEPYRSLSAAAEAITGVHWSGPRFFGLAKVKSK